jgi:hypothetical protein
MSINTEDSIDIIGQIYLIHNSVSNKNYVGQTLSHRKNKGKYKPFGYEGRFRDHISEAVCNTKKKQCRYLNNTIRLHGKESFSVSLLHTCPKQELDMWERHFIEKHNTLYPNGYNLTRGGKTMESAAAPDVEKLQLNIPQKRGGCETRTSITRERISAGIKKSLESDGVREALAKRTRAQHMANKLKRFQGVTVNTSDSDQYIRYKHNNGRLVIIISVDGRKASFTGLHETDDELKQQATQFLLEVANAATLSNCSGNP